MTKLRDGVLVVPGSYLLNNSQNVSFLADQINHLGCLSAVAQNLNDPITTESKFKRAFPEQTIFLLVMGEQVLGFIKTGRRRLFLSNGSSDLVDSNPICVLDFFLKDQRCGYGTILFNAMLSVHKISPFALAFDRPSEKLKSFLIKKFNFLTILQQNNFFAISSNFFHPESHRLHVYETTLCSLPIRFIDKLD